jgi:GxxExxY protein
MKEGDLTYLINGCAMKTHQKLGRGFMEYMYCRGLAIELRRIGVPFQREVWLPVYYDNYKIGARRVDFLCDTCVTVEVKAKSALEEKDFAQALNTLGRLNIPEGLLFNFGAKSLEYRHLFNVTYEKDKKEEALIPEMVGESNDDLFELRDYIPAWVIHKMQMDRAKKK